MSGRIYRKPNGEYEAECGQCGKILPALPNCTSPQLAEHQKLHGIKQQPISRRKQKDGDWWPDVIEEGGGKCLD